MIQVFLARECPHCGQYMVEHDHILWPFRNLPQYKDTYDSSVFFYIDIIRDNAEASAIIELCRKYKLNYHVWDENELAEFDPDWKEFMAEFISVDAVEVEWLRFLSTLLEKT